MNLPSTSTADIDPDYVLSESDKDNLKLKEEKAAEEWHRKVKAIINREFKRELELREKQLEVIQQRITKTSKTLHLLRYVLVSSYYDNNDTILPEHTEDEFRLADAQNRLHPAIKKLLGSDKNTQILNNKRKIRTTYANNSVTRETEEDSLKATLELDTDNIKLEIDSDNIEEINNSVPTTSLVRNRVLTRHVIIVGNISKYIPSKNPNDKLSHKWMVYVRGPKDNPDISAIVNKVVFYLHPSYRPNDIVDIGEYPFHLTRRGWGEFPLRVQICFKNGYNKPVDIIHNLKLDKTFIGKQTLGSETVAEVKLYDANETCAYLEPDDLSQEIIPPQNNEHIKSNHSLDFANIPDYLLDKEELDKNTFFINDNLDIEQDIKQEIEEYNVEFNVDNLNVLDYDEIDLNLLENQRNVDSDHNYSRYTILNGLKRKADNDVPILYCKRFRLSQLKENDNSNAILIYDNNRLRSVLQYIKFLLRKMPLVTDLAYYDSNYKETFPYAAKTLYEYSCWNAGKRQAAEWYRARMIKNAVLNSDLPCSLNWNTKKIVLFARAYGFTPFPVYAPFRFNIYQEHLMDLKSPCRPAIQSPIKSDNHQVDITDDTTRSLDELIMNGSKQFVSHPLTKKYKNLIKETAFEVGVILREDEIIPGVCLNTTETLMLKAVMCFADDLLRSARADAVYKGRFQENEECILAENVINALNTYRSEFKHVTEFNKYTKLF